VLTVVVVPSRTARAIAFEDLILAEGDFHAFSHEAETAASKPSLHSTERRVLIIVARPP